MSANPLSAFALSLALLLLACGDDGGDGGTDGGGDAAVGERGANVETGLDRDTSLAELDHDQALQACEAVARAAARAVSADEAARAACVLLTYLDRDPNGPDAGADTTDCEARTAQCVQQADEFAFHSCDVDTLAALECDATVADFERCATALVATGETLAEAITCENLADPEAIGPALSTLVGVEGLAECESIASDCGGAGLVGELAGDAGVP